MQAFIEQLQSLDIPAESKTAIAKLLTAPESIKILHAVQDPKVHEPTPGMKRLMLLDTETTGLNRKEDEVIELGYTLVEFSNSGELGNVIKAYNQLNAPVLSITNSEIHGITNDMVEGQKIDWSEVEADLEATNLVMAHNAGFDRPFVERYCPAFEQMPWACTHKDIDWKARNISSNKQEYLAFLSGLFYEAHRAVNDVYALLEVIRRLDLFKEALLSAMKPQFLVKAMGSPFSKKDLLKERGYRPYYSAGKFVCWYTLVGDGELIAEKNWLRAEASCRETPHREITSVDRYSIREEIGG